MATPVHNVVSGMMSGAGMGSTSSDPEAARRAGIASKEAAKKKALSIAMGAPGVEAGTFNQLEQSLATLGDKGKEAMSQLIENIFSGGSSGGKGSELVTNEEANEEEEVAPTAREMLGMGGNSIL